jgi:hypothetical protein
VAAPEEWAKAYARQALADFSTWQALAANADAPTCHRLQCLQMACEKLCKARLIDTGTPPEALQSSHGYVAGPLPVFLRMQWERMGESTRANAGLLVFVRHVAAEIEVLCPAVDRDGRRPDNCEYPWEDAKHVLHSPLDWSFSVVHLLRGRLGPRFLDILQQAITRAVDDRTP